MWRLLKTKLNNFNFSKHKDSEKKDEPCPYEEFVKEQEEVLKDNDRKQKFVHEPIELSEMKSVTTEDGRRYQTPEGLELPSITTVLSILSRKRKLLGENE